MKKTIPTPKAGPAPEQVAAAEHLRADAERVAELRRRRAAANHNGGLFKGGLFDGGTPMPKMFGDR